MSTAKIAIGAGALSLAAAAVWFSRTLLASEKPAANGANAEAAVRGAISVQSTTQLYRTLAATSALSLIFPRDFLS
jgi:hypothetical protein